MAAPESPGTPLRARPPARPALPAQAFRGVMRIAAAPHEDPGRSALLHVPADWTPTRPAPLVVMLHGSGGNPQHGLALLQPAAEAAGAIVLAPASVEYTWDGILGQAGRDIASIDVLLEWVFTRYAIDPARVAIGGFSDGASYALSLAIGNGTLFRHCIALSPGFIPGTQERGRPAVFISHGTDDRVLPISRCSRRIVPALQRAGYEVDYREFRGGHEIPPAIASAAVEWWLRRGGCAVAPPLPDSLQEDKAMLNQTLKESIQSIERSLDDALRAAHAGSAPEELRQTLQMLHAHAAQAGRSCQGAQQGSGHDVGNMLMQMEREADRAVESCRNAAAGIDPATQRAVQQAHDEISSLKKQVVGQTQLH